MGRLFLNKSLEPADRQNKLQQVLSPNQNDDGVWINQDAWFHLSGLDAGKSLSYSLKEEGNGVYIFVLKGQLDVGGQSLRDRDGLGITETNAFEITATTASELLLMEVPMK